MKILLTGANGMLGKDLSTLLKKDNEVAGIDLPEVDVSDIEQVRKFVRNQKYDIIAHLAAMTNLDECEKNPQQAFLVNVVGTQNIVLLAQELNIPVLYLSTGCVFDGKSTEPYKEFDPKNPVNVYGRTKLLGEYYITHMLNSFFIVRSCWLFGGGRRDKKFVAKILEAARERDVLQVVKDNYGSPTYTKDLANALYKLMKSGYYGIYHIANEGVCSRYGLAKAILEYGGITRCSLEGVEADHFHLPAKRQIMEGLNCEQFALRGFEPLRPWQEALKDYLNEILIEYA